MDVITLEGVGKRWSAHAVLKDISLSVRQGSLTVLLGPSGCGKSTTLRLIAGLERATSGRIRINGRDVTDAPPSQRDVSMVFQSYALFPHLTVAENIVFGMRVRRVERNERETRLREAADMMGLTPYLKRKPSQLSGGQQQRVALARAIVARRPICLMDEPLSNLDAKLRADMRREIRALQQSLNITMVYVTHDQTEAMTMADQIILLRDGEIEQDGTPEQLYGTPQSTFVASFIGAPPMNLLEQEVLGATGSDVAPLPFERACVLGVRPEEVYLTESAAGLPATVTHVEYLGSDSILSCRVGQGQIVSRVPGRTDLSIGKAVRLGWLPTAVHRFDGETRARFPS